MTLALPGPFATLRLGHINIIEHAMHACITIAPYVIISQFGQDISYNIPSYVILRI